MKKTLYVRDDCGKDLDQDDVVQVLTFAGWVRTQQTTIREAVIEFAADGSGKKSRGMSETQYYVLMTIPLVGILMNGGLFLYTAGRVDALAKAVGVLDSRGAVVETRLQHLEERS